MARAVDMYDVAPTFLRGPLDLFDCSDAPVKHQFSSEERWDVGVDEEDDSYLTELSSGLESWSSTDTEGELICGEALILADVAASSHDSASGAPANAPDMATWMHHAPAPRAWAVHHSMVADAHMSAAHREPVLSVPYGAPAFGVLTVPTYAPAYSFHNYDSVMGSLVVDPLDKQLGSKRLFPVEFLHHDFAYDSFSPRPKSARISSKRTQDLLRIEAAAVASASAAAAVPSIPHVPTPASVAVLEQARPLVCQPAANRASQHQPGGKTTILQCCKFTSKQTQAACKGQLTIVLHKRGHLAVSCSSRHQWVWCSMCCNCVTGVKSTNGRQRGCSVPTHWFERDAFDTGARNHMNVHKSGVTK